MTERGTALLEKALRLRIELRGVRLGTFRLDPSGTQIEEWLRRDDFSHPERE
jgi:hypothetical protein